MSKNKHAVKMLICGFEASGKTSTTAKIENALIVNFDHKAYGHKVPHINSPKFTGTRDLVNTLNTKLGAYKEKFGKLPETVVFDTVTQLYTAMNKYANDKYKGFDVHSNLNKVTLDFNEYVEDTLIKNGVNVIIVAHTIYDQETSRHIIPASGMFAKAGSWLTNKIAA